MHPVLFSFGPVTLYTYGAMMVAAFLTATLLAAHVARRLPADQRPMNPERVVDFSSVILLGGLAGGRLFFILLHWDEFVPSPWEALALWHGGLVWYGGFVGGLAGAWLYVRAQRLNMLRVLDFYVPFLALGHAIGRIGCFFNGCCYGKPADSWCGVTFPGQNVRVIPTQLIEAICLAVLFLLLRSLQRPSVLKCSGRVFGAYLVGYAVIRFVVESLRGDQVVWVAGLTLQQVISLSVLLSGLLLVKKMAVPKSDSHQK
ncbi:MAG: prolipoprotein diacylglyceryl transferase [Candidatus Omnitrophica bacterium]|nr:prolipoprotein diacylglyceryl transferase [Candidatus Omnitrophota bacterium]